MKDRETTYTGVYKAELVQNGTGSEQYHLKVVFDPNGGLVAQESDEHGRVIPTRVKEPISPEALKSGRWGMLNLTFVRPDQQGEY